MSESRLESPLPEEVSIQDRDRYASHTLLEGWEQRKIREATVLVIGAGALGNEVIKNLALVGIGRLWIVDYDHIEMSNLTRSVLFREADRGARKAEVAAARAQQLNPDVEVGWLHGDVTRSLGLGAFRQADAIIGCLDNRAARLFVNRACYKVDKPWIDGALYEMLGEARTFWPGRGACYECTLTAADYQAINLRYSCTSLARETAIGGARIAATINGAAIIAAIQSQESLKLIHGMEVAPGKGLVFNGLNNDLYSVAYGEKASCPSHQSYGPILEGRGLSAAETTVGEALGLLRDHLGPKAVLQLDYDLLVDFECVYGHGKTSVLKPLSTVPESTAECPECGATRWSVQVHSIQGHETFLERTLGEIGVPGCHVLLGRQGKEVVAIELSGDRDRLFERV